MELIYDTIVVNMVGVVSLDCSIVCELHGWHYTGVHCGCVIVDCCVV